MCIKPNAIPDKPPIRRPIGSIHMACMIKPSISVRRLYAVVEVTVRITCE